MTQSDTNTVSSSPPAKRGCELYPRFPNSKLKKGFCAFEYPIDIEKPRMIISIGTSDALVLERGTRSVTLLRDTNNDGVPDKTQKIVSHPNLNHGLQIRDNYIYASSDEIVYRWKYTNTTHNNFVIEEGEVEPTIVIDNIDSDGKGGAPEGHTTRTLIFDEKGLLYVSVGSAGNVDENSFRSRIRRFDISDEGRYPIDFRSGHVFADGLRNEVGLAFDRFGVLWGVENGADNLKRSDLGKDIYNDNPGEELNRFPEKSGQHFGYPYCWTEYSLPSSVSRGRGSVWSWPGSPLSDNDCESMFDKSALSMQAHSAPLGIVFYQWKSTHPASCGNGKTAFPKWMDGYAFIAFHGSWNREVPTGYKVVYVPMNSTDGMVAGEPIDLLSHEGKDAKWGSGYRPVDLDFDECGRLVVTSDGTRGRGANVVRIEYGSSGNASAAMGNGLQAVTMAYMFFVAWSLLRWT